MSDAIFWEQLQARLSAEGIEWALPDDYCFDVTISSEKLPTVIHILKEMTAFYLAAITGLDDGVEANTLEVLYHFCNRACVITFRVQLNREQAIIPSICSIFPYASPFERETGEMFGIAFTDTPDTSRLFLPDDWLDGMFPLRKDANLGEVQHDDTE